MFLTIGRDGPKLPEIIAFMAIWTLSFPASSIGWDGRGYLSHVTEGVP